MSIYNFNFDQLGRLVVIAAITAILFFLAYKIFTWAENAVKAAKNRSNEQFKQDDDFFFGELKDIHDFK